METFRCDGETLVSDSCRKSRTGGIGGGDRGSHGVRDCRATTRVKAGPATVVGADLVRTQLGAADLANADRPALAKFPSLPENLPLPLIFAGQNYFVRAAVLTILCNFSAELATKASSGAKPAFGSPKLD